MFSYDPDCLNVKPHRWGKGHDEEHISGFNRRYLRVRRRSVSWLPANASDAFSSPCVSILGRLWDRDFLSNAHNNPA
jgi:hypothetical protein